MANGRLMMDKLELVVMSCFNYQNTLEYLVHFITFADRSIENFSLKQKQYRVEYDYEDDRTI